MDPFSWDFGDNTPVKQGSSATHTYTAPGTYHVVLTGQDAAGNTGTGSVDVVVTTATTPTTPTTPTNPGDGTIVKPPHDDAIGGDDGTRTTTVGSLKVIAPKKHRLGKKPTPILLALTVTQPGTFEAALTKGPKVVAKGASVFGAAGTFGFKLALPKNLTPGGYALQLTYVSNGAASGATSTIPIKFKRARSHGRALAGVETGPDRTARSTLMQVRRSPSATAAEASRLAEHPLALDPGAAGGQAVEVAVAGEPERPGEALAGVGEEDRLETLQRQRRDDVGDRECADPGLARRIRGLRGGRVVVGDVGEDLGADGLAGVAGGVLDQLQQLDRERVVDQQVRARGRSHERSGCRSCRR